MVYDLDYEGIKFLKKILSRLKRKICINVFCYENELTYPVYVFELHELHNDYPLAPENLEISQNILSKYCSNIADKYGIKIGGVNKLIPNLRNKSKYFVHYRNLQLYLSLEMKLPKVYQIFKFKQSDWLKKYFDFNADETQKCC